MKNIGLDFGTTNSTLSYIDPQRRVPECYRMRSASGSYYIPSFIRYDRDDGNVEIGRGAKKSIHDEDFDVYSGFKMLIGETDSKRLETYGYFERTPKECAADFIKTLIADYMRENRIEAVEQIVLTAPEIWVKEQRHKARETLKMVCSDLDLPLKRFLSEPVAALAYFTHCHRRKNGRPFFGHALVCDYGGGTLDLSLSRVSGEAINVLECTGKGHDPASFGKAGVAFDEAVVRMVYEREKRDPLLRINPEFHRILEMFEDNKIDRKADVDKVLSQYLKMNTVNKKAFKIDGTPFFAADFYEAFNTVIRPELLKALEEMRTFFGRHGVDEKNQDSFRVILAGGFSGFYLVGRTIMEFFNAGTVSDNRFNSCFSVEDTALAVAKGAALVAEELVSVDYVCPISLGLRLKQDDEGNRILKEMDIPILHKGAPISEYKRPVFLKTGVKINFYQDHETPVVVFLGDGDQRYRIRIDKQIHQLFPGFQESSGQWRVGFSVDENYLFTFHAENPGGDRFDTPLGDLLSRVSGLILVKEGD